MAISRNTTLSVKNQENHVVDPSKDEIVKTYIYGLECPISKQIRYIGKSNNPKARYSNHMNMPVADVNMHKKRWIKKVLATGQKPTLIILEEVNEDIWEDAEIKWIAKGLKLGWKLTNKTSGGACNFFPNDTGLDVVEALSRYTSRKNIEALHKAKFEDLRRIAIHAAHSSMKFFFGIGVPRDQYKANTIKTIIINKDLSSLVF